MSYFISLITSLTSYLILIFILIPHSYATSHHTEQELKNLEKEFIQLINQANNIIQDPLATQYINSLGKKLANSSHFKTYFFIPKSNEINAFAGPGGYIGVNSELILSTTDENELAAVMAHEIAHVRLRHLESRLEHSKQMQIPLIASILASAALGAINPTLAEGAMMASLSGFTQDNINYTRSKEKEADRIGIQMLIASGFNPKGMINFFKKLQQHTRYYSLEHVPQILRTHPLDEERIAEAENRIQTLTTKFNIHSLDYKLFKEIIRVNTSSSANLLDYFNIKCKTKNKLNICQYGYGLTLIKLNRFQEAKKYLLPLVTHKEGNLFYQIALSQAEKGAGEFNEVLPRLNKLYISYPENYAIITNYAETLIASGNIKNANNILLKGFRIYNQDIKLCERLAEVEATIKQKAYAYFTKSQCQLIQGNLRNAMRDLKTAQILAKNNSYLTARIIAKIEEIKFLIN